MKQERSVARALAGKTRGAFGFASIFGRHPLHQGKGWKTNLRVVIEK